VKRRWPVRSKCSRGGNAPTRGETSLLSPPTLGWLAPARDDRHCARLRAKLLIADEPTTALDVTIQAQILNLLDELRERLNMATILITHDLGVIAGRTDRVLVMYGGRIVEEARTEALFASPQHPYTTLC